MKGVEVSYLATVQCTEDMSATVNKLTAFGPIEEVVVGCETGVLCADQRARPPLSVEPGVSDAHLLRHAQSNADVRVRVLVLARAVSHALGVNSNGIERSGLRRNKYEQIEAVRAAGRSVAARRDTARLLGFEPEPCVTVHT